MVLAPPLPSRAQVGDAFLYLRVYVQDAAAAGGWSASGSARFQLIGQDQAVKPAPGAATKD